MQSMDKQAGLPLEIERKYLIEMPDEAFLLAQPGCLVRTITQDYLPKTGGSRARVRKSTSGAGTVFTHTAKQFISTRTRVELEREISEEEYLAYLAERDPSRHSIRKTRYAFPFGGHTIEIDIFPFWTDQAVLETELGSEDEEALLPPFIRLIREVTDDPAYTNAALAANDALFPEEEPAAEEKAAAPAEEESAAPAEEKSVSDGCTENPQTACQAGEKCLY